MVLIRYWALRFLSIFTAGQSELLASAYVVSKVFVHHGWIPESVDSQFQKSGFLTSIQNPAKSASPACGGQ
jgi:hypothetical protein